MAVKETPWMETSFCSASRRPPANIPLVEKLRKFW